MWTISSHFICPHPAQFARVLARYGPGCSTREVWGAPIPLTIPLLVSLGSGTGTVPLSIPLLGKGSKQPSKLFG